MSTRCLCRLCLAIGLVLLAGCARLVGDRIVPKTDCCSGDQAFTSPPTAALGGQEAKVSLLARAFLPGAKPSENGFAYYAYLLFAVKNRPTTTARLGAAAAYLDMFSDVSRAGEHGVPKQHMAVLYAPVLKDEASRLIESKDPEVMLKAYNYDRARVIVGALRREGRKVPDVAIVGCRHPLDQGAQVDIADVAVVDLMLSDDAKIRERMQSFETKLQVGKKELNESGENVLLHAVRQWFAIVGMAADSVSKVITIS